MTTASTPYGASVNMSTPGMPYARVDMVHQSGIIIFVHGVNSDGEWYDAAEEGLLKGLNTRMALDQALSGDAALRPVTYTKELKPDGNLNREVKGDSFIADSGHSPVIRFRWGYKAAGQDGTPGAQDEVAEFGGKIYLNEINPLPGSLQQHLWKASGLSNVELVDRLIELAEQRFEAKQHFWQCPGCQAWDSYPARRVEEL